jgi:hypothetical protein
MMDLDLASLPKKIKHKPGDNAMFKILLDEVKLLWVWIVSYVLGKAPEKIKEDHTKQTNELLPQYIDAGILSVTDSIKIFNGIEIVLKAQNTNKPDINGSIFRYWLSDIGFNEDLGYFDMPKKMIIFILTFILGKDGDFLYKEFPNRIFSDPKDVEFYRANCIQLPKLIINPEKPSQYELIFDFLRAEYWAQVREILSTYNKLYGGKPGGELMSKLVEALVSYNVDKDAIKVYKKLKKQENY